MDTNDGNMKSITPARVGVGRAGTRPRTNTWLEFRADHARARDAVHSELSADFLAKLKDEYSCQQVQSTCTDRADFVLFPPKGKRLSAEAIDQLKSTCIKGADVQIVISDGLSAQAAEANIPDLLPILQDGLTLEKFSTGTVVVVKLGRVAVADQIAEALNAKLVINLIGERPGLSCAESLSAYITLNPGAHTISSDRTVISNIHKQGTPPLEAGAYIVQLIKRIFKLQLSGVKLQQARD